MRRMNLSRAAMSLGVAALVTFAQSADAALVTFEAGDLAANFNVLGFPVTESPTAGTNSGPGLTISGTADGSATLMSESLDFSVIGTSLTSSAFYHTPATFGTGEVRVSDLGFLSENTNFLNVTNAHVAARTRANADGSISVIFRNSNADTGTASGNSSILSTNSWYRQRFTMVNTDGAGALTLSYALDLYDATGTTLDTPDVFTVTRNTTSAALAADTAVWGGLRLRNATRFADAVDNFAQVANPVPEPGTLALLAIGAASLLSRRRRSV